MMEMLKTLSVALMIGFLAKGCHSQSNVCGVAFLNNRIVGGENAAPGSWPWQAIMQASDGRFCGGSFISSGWVLTAAHCVNGYAASELTVYLGVQALDSINPNSVSRSVSKVIVHPSYSTATNDNDIALLQLKFKVTVTPYIFPVCLAAAGSTFFNGTLIWVTGFGNIATDVNLPAPGILQEVEMPIIGNRQCNCFYGVGTITENMMCAGLLTGGKDSCQGDSGGAMVLKQGDIWIQAGIVSFGAGCAQPDQPGVYARLSRYQNWINQQTTSNQPGFVTYTSTGWKDADLSVSCPGLPPITTRSPVSRAAVKSALPCGFAKLNNITGRGKSLASAGMWPWMASVQYNHTHVCGGTLIAEQKVLTSADCFSSSTTASEWTVILGRLKQNGVNPNEISINVTKISLSKDTKNNIALLHLSHKPKLSEYIQPICVNQGNINFTVNSQCWVTGWSSGGGAEQTLQQFNTTILDCGSESSPNSICTGAIPLEQTDTGGPLMCKTVESWFQAAVLTVFNNNTKTSRAADVQIFTKTNFTSLLEAGVRALSRNTNITSTSTTVSTIVTDSSSFLSATNLLLLSLTALIHTFI